MSNTKRETKRRFELIYPRIKTHLDYLKSLVDNFYNWQDYVAIEFSKGTPKADISLRVRKGRKVRSVIVGKDKVMFDYNGREYRLYYETKGQLRDAMLFVVEQFILEQYACLRVRGEDVVDIGASIGDSAISFAVSGARHVYAYEPFPFTYKIAKKNIMANRLGGRISLYNAGCGSPGKVHMESGFRSVRDSETGTHGKRGGQEIRLFTLRDILRSNKIRHPAILKIDCEGCEYALINEADSASLRMFKRIYMEYHYGYGDIAEKLSRSGFHVVVSHPIYGTVVNGRKRVVGDLFAIRGKYREDSDKFASGAYHFAPGEER